MTLIIFFGSDRFSAVVLNELINQNHPPTLVITDPPKPQGRSKLITANEVEKIALSHQIKVLYYQANLDRLINLIINDHPVGLAASFPHLFPLELIQAFNGQLYNLHPSLLPQYRNVAPVPYAIALGDSETGITLQHIDAKIDHGSIVAQAVEPIHPTDTTPSLLNRLFTIGAKLFSDHLTNKPPTQTSVVPNRHLSDPLIFTRKLTRESGFIEWDVLQKLIANKPITKDETINPLIQLRLNHHPERPSNILPDLIRALEGYERVWTNAPTKKGLLTISISFTSDHNSLSSYHLLLSGKPKPITYLDFVKYYL